ncbi:NOL1/NOP2/sun family putative RNA methylase [Deferribacter autotrophicus]|uniref:NOL1/NOP2/sun family putative RNA methylase n=1 Tax=Deferribacter autotrophicus TaxID=500465 RepID=A0A5A8F7V7_9BACT|nr:RsmB/NOP family class I SAM-dependent RNA methyltransferase [Deferribacter autotrophicus]KAA0259559.1 NOL1/NOP2/sun family putative RNA methylase [Deferribacter autotrophicus]
MNRSFLVKYKELLGDEFDLFIDSLKKQKEKFVRINCARNINYLEELDYLNVEYQLDNNFKNVAKVIDDEFVLSNTIAFKTGGFYIQNPSSLIPVKFLLEHIDVDEPIILDMAASPGGKTTALSEYLGRKGLIIANEPSKKRLKNLQFNIEKYGAWNVATVSYDGRYLHKFCESVFDAVLLDAPCSNENKIFRDKTVLNSWDEDLVKKLSKLQKELVDSAIKVLKKGGILIYSTCTFSPEENEDVVKYVLDKYDVELLDLNKNNFCKGLSGDAFIDERVVRVFPHHEHLSGYDGFFVAGFKKKYGDEVCAKVSRSNVSINNTFQMDNSYCLYESNGYLFLSSKFLIDGLRYEKSGIRFGKLIGKEIEYSTQCCWEFGSKTGLQGLEVDYESAMIFLKGNDLVIDKEIENKKGLLFFKKLPIGMFKNINGKLKNKIDRYFIRGLI